MKNVELGLLFQEGCVLQRDKTIKIWGNGTEGTQVTVTLDGNSSCDTIKDGTFFCVLPAHSAAIGLTLKVSAKCKDGTEEIEEIEHVSVGDVWLAGGQSNMEFFLRYDAHYEETMRQPKNNNIHMFNVPRIAYRGQVRKVNWDSGYWFEEQDEAWENFSAPGYYFVRDLQPRIDVPIGIIGCNWGGTPACAWMSEEYLEDEPLHQVIREYEADMGDAKPEQLYQDSLIGFEHEDSDEHQKLWQGMMYGLSLKEQKQWMIDHADDPAIPIGPWHMYRPSGLYHQMLEKVIPYSIKGAIWYQGESDSCHADLYGELLENMIKCWREKWGDEFPFLFVQLAPFELWLDCTGDHYPEVRHQQELVAKRVPGTGMISIMDLGMYEDIHPKRKKEVGERLALLARGVVYGEEILCHSPELLSGEMLQDSMCVKLYFAHTGDGLELRGDDAENIMLGGFEVEVDGKPCGFDIELQKENILINLAHKAVNSCRVKFAWKNYVKVNLFNSAGLPVKPFTWEM